MKEGRLIVVDGGEGSGKGTVLSRIKDVLPPDKVLYTREPGGSRFAEEIRALILSPHGGEADALTQFCLFCAARADHSIKKILPAISDGRHVISDRYDISTWGYQVRAEDNTFLIKVFWLMRELCCPVKPYLYIYLDVDPHEGLRRARDRGELNHFDARGVAFHTKVRIGCLEFLEIMKTKGSKTLVVDANRSIEQVTSDVLDAVRAVII